MPCIPLLRLRTPKLDQASRAAVHERERIMNFTLPSYLSTLCTQTHMMTMIHDKVYSVQKQRDEAHLDHTHTHTHYVLPCNYYTSVHLIGLLTTLEQTGGQLTTALNMHSSRKHPPLNTLNPQPPDARQRLLHSTQGNSTPPRPRSSTSFTSSTCSPSSTSTSSEMFHCPP
eukprot:1263449-Amphidinium_carterae.1